MFVGEPYSEPIILRAVLMIFPLTVKSFVIMILTTIEKGKK